MLLSLVRMIPSPGGMVLAPYAKTLISFVRSTRSLVDVVFRMRLVKKIRLSIDALRMSVDMTIIIPSFIIILNRYRLISHPHMAKAVQIFQAQISLWHSILL